MASHITHYLFGKRIVDRLPREARQVIYRYPEHFLIGNQGPDLFFFHITSKRRHIGPYIHDLPFEYLLFKNRDWLATMPDDTPTWAYFLGLVCHFSLDIAFHPYIDAIEKEISIDHMTIEREFDRHLLEEEHIPFGTFMEREIIPHPDGIVDAVYPIYRPYFNTSSHDIRQALFSFRILLTFFHVNSTPERNGKLALLKALGLDEKFGGMLMKKDGYAEAIHITTPELAERMDLAYSIARRGIASLYDETAGYPGFFRLNFSGR